MSSSGRGWEAGAAGPAGAGRRSGGESRPERTGAARAATGVAGAALAQLLGQLLVAEGRTAALALRWSAGLAVATALLVLLPSAPAVAVAAAFAAGTLTAAAGMAQAGRTAPNGPSGRGAEPPGVGSQGASGDVTA
ncbi:MAG: hypothetical protein ACO3RG_04415 [Nitriliruptoraceae bacterium]